MSKTPSNFQQAITGTWHGLPSVFEADGAHVGFNKVDRESRFDDGVTTYFMRTNFQNTGPLRYRFDLGSEEFAFGERHFFDCPPDVLRQGCAGIKEDIEICKVGAAKFRIFAHGLHRK